jgi:3-deoxy-D-manno-octulosonic-acid transferase/heptosyltransferase-1
MKERKGFQRLLIIKLGSIGDVVHTLPTLNALRRKFPLIHIAWVVGSKSRDILVGHPALDELIVFERTRSAVRTIAAFFHLIRKLRRDRYDVLLELQGDFRGGVLAWLSGTPVRLGFEAGSSRVERISTIFTNVKVSEGDASHIIERNLNFAGRLGVRDKEVAFDIAIGKRERRDISSFLKHEGIEAGKIVILHPGVSWVTKRWSLEGYAELADRIRAHFEDAAVVLTYGPGERPLAEAISRISRSNPLISCPTTLGQLIALLDRCEVMVASDTGPLHLAVALGKKVVGLYGPVDPARNGPYGKGNFAVGKELTCRPCWKKQCGTLSCMKGITVAEVLEKVAAVLHKKINN